MMMMCAARAASKDFDGGLECPKIANLILGTRDFNAEEGDGGEDEYSTSTQGGEEREREKGFLLLFSLDFCALEFSLTDYRQACGGYGGE